jgi:hypothetical protein
MVLGSWIGLVTVFRAEIGCLANCERSDGARRADEVSREHDARETAEIQTLLVERALKCGVRNVA